MKSFKFLWMAVIAISFFACRKDSKQTEPVNETEVNAASKKPVPGNNCGNYSVALSVDKLTEPGHTIFTWTITNPNPGNGSGTTLQDLSHWVFVPGACLDQNWQDVLSASYNTGSGWTQILPTPVIGPDPSMIKGGCFADDVFKFDQGTAGSAPTQYRIVLLGNWGTGNLQAYFKSGANTGCCYKEYAGLGIGCPEQEECSFSQGYWFANNAMHPNGVHPWGGNGSATVTIGGYVYTNAEGLAIWNASNAGGIKDAKKAFTQLAAIRLSGVNESNAGLIAAIATIDSWLSNYGAKLTPANLRNQNAAEIVLYGNAANAATTISDWINANHCDEPPTTDPPVNTRQ